MQDISCIINIKAVKGKDMLHNKKKAFTLAETLITLTIIGVIAALTIPTLYANYQKHTYVIGLKKAYSQLQNAVKMIPVSEGCAANECSYGVDNVSKQFKTIKDCKNHSAGEFEDYEKCLYNDLKYRFYPETFMNKNSYSGVVSSDGVLYFDTDFGIAVDVNGAKKPNIWGRDIFMFYTEPGIAFPIGSRAYSGYIDETLEPDDINSYYWKNYCVDNIRVDTLEDPTSAYYCTGRVLEEDAMNY